MFVRSIVCILISCFNLILCIYPFGKKMLKFGAFKSSFRKQDPLLEEEEIEDEQEQEQKDDSSSSHPEDVAVISND